MNIRQLYKDCIAGPWTTGGNDVQWRLEEKDGIAFLFFQWSNSITDWIANLDYPAEAYRSSPLPWKCHRGFMRNYKSVQGAILNKLNEMMPKRLIIAGYSHGGALAQFAHEDVVYNFPVIEVETHIFGSPRVLWCPPLAVRKRFATLHNWQRRGDLVTMLPPWLLGYCHVGKKHPVGSFSLPHWKKHMADEYIPNLPEN